MITRWTPRAAQASTVIVLFMTAAAIAIACLVATYPGAGEAAVAMSLAIAAGSGLSKLIPPRLRRIAIIALLMQLGSAVVFCSTLYEDSDSRAYFLVARALSGHGGEVSSHLNMAVPGSGAVYIISKYIEYVFYHSPVAVGVVFAFIGWLGSLCFIRGSVSVFRNRPRATWWYAICLFFWPDLIFWHSIQGKDAITYLGLGLCVWGSSLLGGRRLPRPLTLLTVGTLLIFVIRPHVALIFVGALVVALVLGRREDRAVQTAQQRRRRNSMLALLIVAVAALGSFSLRYVDRFLKLDDAGVTQIAGGLASRTTIGGSAFSTASLTSPMGLLLSVPTVLFRPFPYEADSVVMLLSSLTALVTMALAVWALLRVLIHKEVREMLQHHVMRTALVVVLLGGLVFGSVGNFGIIVRQRTQLTPFLLLIVLSSLPVGDRSRRISSRPVAAERRMAGTAPRPDTGKVPRNNGDGASHAIQTIITWPLRQAKAP